MPGFRARTRRRCRVAPRRRRQRRRYSVGRRSVAFRCRGTRRSRSSVSSRSRSRWSPTSARRSGRRRTRCPTSTPRAHLSYQSHRYKPRTGYTVHASSVRVLDCRSTSSSSSETVYVSCKTYNGNCLLSESGAL